MEACNFTQVLCWYCILNAFKTVYLILTRALYPNPRNNGARNNEARLYRIIPYTCTVHECEDFGAGLLVLKRGPNHDLQLWVKSASKSDW